MPPSAWGKVLKPSKMAGTGKMGLPPKKILSRWYMKLKLTEYRLMLESPFLDENSEPFSKIFHFRPYFTGNRLF